MVIVMSLVFCWNEGSVDDLVNFGFDRTMNSVLEKFVGFL